MDEMADERLNLQVSFLLLELLFTDLAFRIPYL
jgi:hypothetical protein